jgi:hypothetical protein
MSPAVLILVFLPFQLAAPEGFLVGRPAPACTMQCAALSAVLLPGSLAGCPSLLVSIIAFDVKYRTGEIMP